MLMATEERWILDTTGMGMGLPATASLAKPRSSDMEKE